jgi:hypothetical protein
MTRRGERVEEKLEAIDWKLDALAASVDARFDAVDGRFNEVTVSLVEQREYTEFAFDRLRTEMTAGFASVNANLGRLERKLDQVLDRASGARLKWELSSRHLVSKPRPDVGQVDRAEPLDGFDQSLEAEADFGALLVVALLERARLVRQELREVDVFPSDSIRR